MEKETLGLSERMAKVEGILEQMSQRFNHLESRMASFESRVDSEFKAIRAEMNSHFRWMLALLITMWVTIIVAVLFK